MNLESITTGFIVFLELKRGFIILGPLCNSDINNLKLYIFSSFNGVSRDYLLVDKDIKRRLAWKAL